MSRQVSLSSLIYRRACVDEAISAYAHVCAVEVCHVTSRGCDIKINVLPDTQLEEHRVVSEFLNYLLELSLERHLMEAHERVRDGTPEV